MAAWLLLIIFINVFHDVKAEAPPQPELTVDRTVITETDSVTLNCSTPSSVSVTKCYFSFMRRKPAKRFSCLKTLTGSKLLSLTEQSSPANVDVTCSYLSSYRSPESNMFNIIIQFPQPELRVNPSLITETDSVTVNCSTPSFVSVNECYLFFGGSKTARTISCVETLTGSELLSLSRQNSPAEVELRCSYTVKLRSGQYLSPNSNITSVNIQNVVKTNSTTSQTPAVSVTTDLTVSSTTWYTKNFSSTSLTSVKPASDTKVSTATETTTLRSSDKVSNNSTIQPDVKNNSTASQTPTVNGTTGPDNKLGNKLYQRVLIVIFAVLGFGVVVGLISLGGTLPCFDRQRRLRKVTEKFFYARPQTTSPGDVRGVTDSDKNKVLPVINNDGYTTITSVPAANAPIELQQMNRHDSQNETPDVYHVYADVIDEPAASILKNSMYCTVQAH